MSTEKTGTELDLVVKMAIDAWETQNKRIDKLLNELSEEQWNTQIAPGKNRGTYILGHLIAVNDNLLPLFGFGEKFQPQLGAIFLANPDNTDDKHSLTDLKQYWSTVNSTLSERMRKLSSLDWFTRHNSVSEEDFAKEPHRNKLSVLLNRTTHQAYHVGQLVLLQKK